MTDIKEMITLNVKHNEPSEHCPFCPPPDFSTYTSYPGAKNDSTKLRNIMINPGKLVSLQKGARPQTGKVGSCGYTQEQEEPQSRGKDSTKPYAFQAHHLISGKQALKGNVMEDWILKSHCNEKDTGYSVNCTANGFWAPSVPKKYLNKWSAGKKILTDDERQSEAEKVMEDAKAQFHLGPHNIIDPNDPEGNIHESYDKYIICRLKSIAERIEKWEKFCYLCDSDKKPQANYTVHDVLDKLSIHLKGEISGPRKNWKVFISKYALKYHKSVCLHIDLLKSQGVNNFQAFPAELFNPETGKKRLEFYLFNVIGLLKAVNLDKSDFDVLMPASSDGVDTVLAAFHKIVLDSKKTMEMKMFRLAEDPGTLIIHEEIVDALSNNRPENGWGIDVIEVESV